MLPAGVGDDLWGSGNDVWQGVSVPNRRTERAGTVRQRQPELDAERELVGGWGGVVPFHQWGRAINGEGVDPAFDTEAAAKAKVEFRAAGDDHPRSGAVAEIGRSEER